MRYFFPIIFSFVFSVALPAQNLVFWSQPKDYQLTNGEFLAETEQLAVEVQVITPGEVRESMFSIFVDGRKVENKAYVTSLRGTYFKTTITLKSGLQRIEIVFKNENGEARSKPMPIRFSGKPNLWLLAFGTNPPDLYFTDDDARDVVELFKTQQGKLFGTVNIRKYIADDATAGNMRSGIEEMASLFSEKEIKPADVVMLFISSHGFTKDSVLFLKGSDFRPLAPISSSLDYRFVLQNLAQIQCKKVVFIDACFSGAGKRGYKDINDAVKNLGKYQSGLTTFASSSGDEPSNEDAAWRNGAFTEAVLKGLNGAANTDGDEFITIGELWKFIEKEVPRIVRQVKGIQQTPQLNRHELSEIPIFSLQKEADLDEKDRTRNVETDADGDSVADRDDQCPNEKGKPQHHGCPPPNRDFDELADDEDDCPNDYGPKNTNGCPDSDADGVRDEADDCKYLAGLPALRGCPDTDGDGVADQKDQCKNKKGELKWDGCPDTDGDGLHDGIDQCPDARGRISDNGCPPPNRDGDDLPDAADRCPDVAGSAQLRGCPDSDKDGVPDVDDKCVYLAGDPLKNGCPEVIPEKKVVKPDDPMGLVFVKGGTFTMGSPENEADRESNETQHQVTLSDFYIDKYEMTQKRWTEIMGSNPSNFKNCDQCPVEQVSWDDVQDFLKKLNQKYPGKNYRLPTEAEWEFAARGGGKSVMFGNGKNTIDPAEINFDAREKYKSIYSVVGEYRQKTIPVGSLNSPNALGLHDMSGNVWEWCSDWYGTYPSGLQTNPKGASSGSGRVFRGGSCDGYPRGCRVAGRSGYAPEDRSGYLGFRLASSPQ